MTDLPQLESDQILDRLTAVFREIFDDDAITLSNETVADDIEEWDSLNQIKLILQCERVFGVKLKARDVNTLDNVGAMVRHLLELGASGE